MKDLFRIEINMEQMMCDNCKKTSVDYYQMLLQLRFNLFKDIIQLKKEVFSQLNNNFNTINKIEELKNGFNVYFRNHSEMNKLTKVFQKKYLIEEKRSNKLVGRDFLRSKDIYRYFQSITLLNIKKGDKIFLKGEKFTVKSINKNKELVLLNNLNGSKKVVTYFLIKDYLKLPENNNNFQ